MSTTTQEQPQRAAIRARYQREVGPWSPLYDVVLDADPQLMDAFVELCAVPVRTGHLTPLVREYVGIAVNASTTHLYEPAVRTHIRNALALGADHREIVEVLQLTSVLGIHTCELGLNVLGEELTSAGIPLPPKTDRQRALRERFLSGRGMFPEVLEDVLRFDVELLEAYLQYSSIPWRSGTLPPKVREFVYIAIDASTTKLHEVGTRIHIQNALAAGASREEIVEVLELIAQIGIHACTMALPILLEEAAAFHDEEAGSR
jgi:alkylhydroperoxidase/carboxymuconolactone decarboxylase family protein YurZ